MKNGIDVSVHNGTIDWQKVKSSGIDFAIIRAGYGKLINQKDARFERNYAGATAHGIPVGAYWYSYAVTPDEAKQEAHVFLEAINGKNFEFPVYLDIEDGNTFRTGKKNVNAIIKAFFDVMEKAGYWVGIYTSRSAVQTYISTENQQKYALWVAEWGAKCNYNGTYGMWQKSDKGSCKGITGNVDLDECYIDYPAIIKAAGKNGFTAANEKHTADTAPEPPESLLRPVSEIARQVIEGEWGNGTERVQRLTAAGYDYKAVQAEVNRLLATPSARTHTVRQGDTLSALAKRYGTTVSAIVAANRAKYPRIKPSYICVGWILKV